MENGHPTSEGTEGFPIGEALRFGWRAVLENFGFLIGLTFLIGATLLGSGLLIAFLAGRNEGLSSFLGLCLQLAANSILPTGGIAIALKLCDGIKPQWEDFLCPMKTILFYYVGSLIYGAFVLVGLLFLIVPGIYFGIRFCLMGYYVVDLGLDPIEAIKQSWEATRGQVLNLMGFGLVLFLINLAGMLALFFGLFVTAPLSMVAGTYIYRFLRQRQ